MKNNQNALEREKLEEKRHGQRAGWAAGNRGGNKKMCKNKGRSDTYVKAFDEAYDKAAAKLSFQEQQRRRGKIAGQQAARKGRPKKFRDTNHTHDWIEGYNTGYEKYLLAQDISEKLPLETTESPLKLPETLFGLFLAKNQRYPFNPPNRYYQSLKPKQTCQEALTNINELHQHPDEVSDETRKDLISLPHFDKFSNIDSGASLLNVSENMLTPTVEPCQLNRSAQWSTLFFFNSASPKISETKENQQSFVPIGPYQ